MAAASSGTSAASGAYSVMSAADYYLAMAKHCRRARASTQDEFTRYYLERMEHSDRVLASSKAVVDRSERTQQALEEWRDKQGPETT